MNDDKYERGMAQRRATMGDSYVDDWLRGMDELAEPLDELITEFAWGTVWTRPGLDVRTRSLLTLSILIAQGRPDEFRLHLRGAINNGCSLEEIREVLMQSAIYCGIPAALSALRVARDELGLDGD